MNVELWARKQSPWNSHKNWWYIRLQIKNQLSPQNRKVQTIFSNHNPTNQEIKYWNRKEVKTGILGELE